MRPALRQLINDQLNTRELYAKICTVDTVDQGKKTCDVTPLDGTAPVLDCRLQSKEQADSGMYVTPTVGSFVIVVFTSNSSAFVALCEEIDKLFVSIGESSMEMNDQEIKFNNGSGGMAVISGLVSRLNNIENKVNSLISSYNSHVHAGVTTGPGSSAVTPSVVAGTLSITQSSDIEDDKILH